MAQDKGGVFGNCFQVVQCFADKIVGAFLNRVNQQESRLMEERGAGRGKQLTGLIECGIKLADLEFWIALTKTIANDSLGAIGQKIFWPRNQHNRSVSS